MNRRRSARPPPPRGRLVVLLALGGGVLLFMGGAVVLFLLLGRSSPWIGLCAGLSLGHLLPLVVVWVFRALGDRVEVPRGPSPHPFRRAVIVAGAGSAFLGLALAGFAGLLAFLGFPGRDWLPWAGGFLAAGALLLAAALALWGRGEVVREALRFEVPPPPPPFGREPVHVRVLCIALGLGVLAFGAWLAFRSGLRAETGGLMVMGLVLLGLACASVLKGRRSRA